MLFFPENKVWNLFPHQYKVLLKFLHSYKDRNQKPHKIDLWWFTVFKQTVYHVNLMTNQINIQSILGLNVGSDYSSDPDLCLVGYFLVLA